MTTQELQSRISTTPSGHGHFRVEIEFRGKNYSCITNNTLAVDCMYDDDINQDRHYVSAKQALLALWNECKRKNNLY